LSGLKESFAIFDSEQGSNLYEHKLKLDKVKNELLKFGLTPNQAKVYIYLGKYGSKTATEVFKALELPRTEAYHILKTLQNRGIITAEFSQPVRFSALSMEKTILTLVNAEKERVNILAEQESDLVELWNDIPTFMVETKETKTEKLQMLQGAPQIHSKIKEMFYNTREEFLIFCTEKDLSRFYHSDFIDMLGNSIVDVKFIISPAQRIPDFLDGINRTRIKIMPNSKTENQCFIVKDYTEVILFLRNANHPAHDVFAVWSDSRSMVDSMHMLFECAWEKSEVIY
jgi:sugar-specific transcriptional regulator TrmB